MSLRHIKQLSKALILTHIGPKPLATPKRSNIVLKSGKTFPYFSSPCLIQSRTKSTISGSSVKRKPLSFDYSGDLVTRSSLQESDILNRFKDVTELENAPEDVKRICSIGMASGVEIKKHRIEEMSNRLEQLFGKDCHREQMIGKLTVEIRSLIAHCLQFRSDKRSKSILVEKIQKRKKYMKFLRREDYERFEWLLDELKIKYIPPPAYYKFVSKRQKRKIEVKDAAYAVRQSKIDALKKKLEAEKEAFMQEKEEILAEIQKEAEKYELDPELFKQSLIREREKSKRYVLAKDLRTADVEYE
ncbi:hypothetical protein SNE40_005855 [Patella caerulea]|uniref:Small ribosomal subunit protein uS15m n=1 Tax=Patella caerulea TaxID=87958 RepID=A0AAN8JXS1_PATCE